MAAREGAQVPFAAYPDVKLTPSFAIESMCGVGTEPLATPPPPNVRSFQPQIVGQDQDDVGRSMVRGASCRIRPPVPGDLSMRSHREPAVGDDLDEAQQQLIAEEPGRPPEDP